MGVTELVTARRDASETVLYREIGRVVRRGSRILRADRRSDDGDRRGATQRRSQKKVTEVSKLHNGLLSNPSETHAGARGSGSGHDAIVDPVGAE